MLYEKLDYVLAIAEERSLTKAAQKLYVSQPTLTVHLNRLESQLGVKLFDRSTTPITITPVGQFYLEKMRQIADQERAVRSSLQGIANPAKTLSIGIGMVRGQHWLPLILPKFCKLHPEVQIQLHQLPEALLSEDLQQGRLDILVGILPCMRSDIEVVDILKEKLFLAASPVLGLLPEDAAKTDLEHPYLLQPEMLDGVPFIEPDVELGLHESYEILLRLNRFQPERAISTNDMHTALKLTAEGLGVQLLAGPLIVLHPDLQQNALDYFVLPNMPDNRKCSIAYRRDTLKTKLIQDFIQIVREDVLPQCAAITPL